MVRFAAEDLAPDAATRALAIATAATLAVVALSAPLLGALADRSGHRKRYLTGFLAVGVAATAALGIVEPAGWRMPVVLFAIANIGAYGSFVFYDALLPHLARGRDIDRLSAAGFALGYLGGGLLLALQLGWVRRPDILGLDSVESGIRLAFLSVALWWVVFSLPLLRRVPDPPGAPGVSDDAAAVRRGGRQLADTFRALRSHRQSFLFLLAFLVYSDGIGTVMRLAAAYATELGIGPAALVGAILLVQLVAAPFTFLFARLADRVGTKRAILVGLSGYVVVCTLGYFVQTAGQFLALAALVGTIQGGTQALSRALFAKLIPMERSAEFFAFFAVSERFAGLAGPMLFAAVGAATGSNRHAILSLIAVFVLGAWLLSRVRIDETDSEDPPAAE